MIRSLGHREALSILAGHTQTFFINLTGLVLYAAYPLLSVCDVGIGETLVSPV